MNIKEQVINISEKYINIEDKEIVYLKEDLSKYSYYNYIKQNRYFNIKKEKNIIFSKLPYCEWVEINNTQLKITKNIMNNIYAYEIELTSLIINYLHEIQNTEMCLKVIHSKIRNEAYRVLERFKIIENYKDMKEKDINKQFEIYKNNITIIIRGITLEAKHNFLLEIFKNSTDIFFFLEKIDLYLNFKKVYEQGIFKNKQRQVKFELKDVNSFFRIIESSRNCIYHGGYWIGDLSHKNKKPNSNRELRSCFYYTFNNLENKAYIEKMTKKRLLYNNHKVAIK